MPIGRPFTHALHCVALFLAAQQCARAAFPLSPIECREFRDAGRVEELAAAQSRERDFALSPLEAWLCGEALIQLNRNAEVLQLAAAVDTKYPRSLVGGFLRHREALLRGDSASARRIAEERLAQGDAGAYMWGREPVDWLLLGRLRLVAGQDAKMVLQTCYERALKEDAQCAEAFEAIAELGIDRGDNAMAADKAREGLKRFPKNPRLHAILGRAVHSASSKEAVSAWERALELNPRENSARVCLAENAFHSEDAAALAEELSKLPPTDTDRSAIELAQLMTGGDSAAAKRKHSALSRNAVALHRAGLLLSARYRFKEAADLQKAALALDPKLLPAQRALAEDLLRLARPGEAWPLLEAVQQLDGYDVTTFNLLEFRDRFARFTKLESTHFEVWMAPEEAGVYGDRVTSLLERAYAQLAPKYGFRAVEKVRVEIFPEQKDFAVKTFGVPGGEGYLGVCFGPLITAPSPASPRASGHSWEATLWHEFTHTITLGLTHNKIPRWLSEGISMFEERQAGLGWGNRFKPRHAARILSGGLIPLDQMSGAFRTGDFASIDFAYLQAGLVVEWMVRKGGMPSLKALLNDLASGMETGAAIEKRFGPFKTANAEFEKYAAQWLRNIGGGLSWKPEKGAPENKVRTYQESLVEAREAVKAGDTAHARDLLEKLANGAPQFSGEGSAYPVLAKLYRKQGLEWEESELWRRALDADADGGEIYDRLIELYAGWRDWQRVFEVAKRSLGVRPMSVAAHEAMWKAAEALGRKPEAATACRTALALDSVNAPRWHSRLGILLEEGDPQESRLHLLEALERNPRDRKALECLARIAAKTTEDKKP